MKNATYRRIHAKAELNGAFIVPVDADENYLVMRVGETDLILEIVGDAFLKTDGTANEVQIQLDVIELTNDSTGGVLAEIGTDLLVTNKDLTSNYDDITELDVYKDDVGTPIVVNTAGKNIFRSGGTASKGATAFEGNLPRDFFSYSLQRNKHYLLMATKIAGVAGTSAATLFGRITEV